MIVCYKLINNKEREGIILMDALPKKTGTQNRTGVKLLC